MEAIPAIPLPAAVAALRAGRVVAFPTGTSYGFAADTLQGFALQRVRNLKRRPAEKTFTVFMDDGLWDQYLDLNPRLRLWLQQLSNYPVTVLVKPKPALAHLAQDRFVGLRVIDHPVMRALAAQAKLPLTATSANLSGEPACLSLDCLRTKFTREVADHAYDLALAGCLDAGLLPSSAPSTIIRPEKKGYTIVREGALPGQTLAEILD